MTRTYTKGKRAEQEAETRQRIVAAALALHGEVGPNATTISMIAERAGVQRHTVYAHLPDERTTFMACSGLHLMRDPLPSPAAWADQAPADRLPAALAAVYGWFARNATLVALVLRDAESNEALREVNRLRFGEAFGAIFQSLSAELGERGQAALWLALSYYSWRTLVREGGLAPATAIALMARTVGGADT